MSIDNDKENKDKSSDISDFYRQNIENYNKFLAEIWKMFFGGFMYWYNGDMAKEMRELYEKNYNQYQKEWNDFYNKSYKNYKP
jgi:hypothetical protein